MTAPVVQPVELSVLSSGEGKQIVGIVVQRVLIDVVHNLVRGEPTPKFLFHHPAVERDLAAIDAYVPVTSLHPSGSLPTPVMSTHVASWLPFRI